MSKHLRLSTALVLLGIGAWPQAGHARDYLAAAQDALSKGDLKTASIDLRNAVRADPQNAAARFQLAQVELQLADPTAAERDARAAAERGFDPHMAIPLVGESLLLQGRAADLLKEFQPQGKDAGLDAERLVLRGEAQVQLGKPDDAKTSFDDAEKLDPNSLPAWIADARLALARGDIATAADRTDHALAVQPKSLDALLIKATIIRLKGDVAGALALLDKMIAEQPPALAARVERANLLAAIGKLAQAKDDVDAVLKVTPGNVQALFLRAALLHQAHDDKSAAAVLQRLDPVFPRFPRAYLLQALVQDQLGESQEAEDSVAKYIARAPQDVSGYKLLAQLYLKDNRPDRALVPLQQAIQADKADAAIYELLGRANLAINQPQAATAAFAKLRQLAPGVSEAEAEYGAALIASGKPDEAVAAVSAALAKEPKSLQLQETLVNAGLATADLSQADAAITKVRQAGGDTPVTLNLAALVQLAHRDPAGAQATLQRILKDKPDFVPALVTLARALSMQGRDSDAEAILAKMLDKDPTAEPALGMLTSGYERTGRGSQAVALLQRAHAAKPQNVALAAQLATAFLKAGEPQKALDLARQSQPAGGAASGPLQLIAADAQMALKKPEDARDTLSKALRLDPSNMAVRQRLASLLVASGDYEGARNLIQEGIGGSPRTYQFYLDYAMIDLKASGLQKALATAEQLRNQDLTFPALAALKGDLYMAAKQPEQAVQAYAAAAATAPSSLLAERLALAYTGDHKPEQARKVLADWVASHPDDIHVTSTLSELDIEANRLDAAETELKAVLAAQPRNAIALNNLAWVYQTQGNADARRLAERAYLLAPSPETADTLGWILTKGGQPAQGAELLRQAVIGGDPRIAYHLGVALNEVGQKDEAVKLLHAVAESKGSFTEKEDAQRLLSQITKGS